jgi:hypothetical protein
MARWGVPAHDDTRPYARSRPVQNAPGRIPLPGPSASRRRSNASPTPCSTAVPAHQAAYHHNCSYAPPSGDCSPNPHPRAPAFITAADLRLAEHSPNRLQTPCSQLEAGSAPRESCESSSGPARRSAVGSRCKLWLRTVARTLQARRTGLRRRRAL